MRRPQRDKALHIACVCRGVKPRGNSGRRMRNESDFSGWTQLLQSGNDVCNLRSLRSYISTSIVIQVGSVVVHAAFPMLEKLIVVGSMFGWRRLKVAVGSVTPCSEELESSVVQMEWSLKAGPSSSTVRCPVDPPASEST